MQFQTSFLSFAFALIVLQSWCVDAQGCTGTCYPPDPRPEPPTNSELNAVHSIRCQLGCIEQHGGSLQMITDYAAWPTLSFSQLESNCVLYQKVQECHSGCVTGFKTPSLSVNRCRDKCFTDCTERVCGGRILCKQHGTSCERKCRKTYCRFGCQQHSALNSTQNGHSLNSPLSVPNITFVQNTTADFHIDVSQAMPAVNSSQQQLPAVNFLFKVEATQLNRVGYYWKHDLQTPLDLFSFSCQQVTVSFAVVSKYNISQYSPKSQICVPGFTRLPSQVDRNSIRVQYREDEREGYFGYSVANVSWQRPSGHQFMTSYTIHILTQTATCGGINNFYSYTNISKDATHFVLYAPQSNGVLKFGCSYTLKIVTLPAQLREVGTYKRIAPELPGPAPQVSLKCSKVWDHEGNFSISVMWTLPNSTQLLETIRHFVITPTLKDSQLIWGFGIIRHYSTHTVQTEDDKFEYSLILPPFRPQRRNTYKYEVQVRTEKKAQYFWRNVPRMQSCLIDSQSLPPALMSNISVSELEFDKSGILLLTLTWLPPTTANGLITEYEVRIEENLPDQGDRDGQVHTQRFPAIVNSASINVTLDVNESTHCLYLVMRSHNEFLPSNWSEPLTLPLDDKCEGFKLNATNSPDKVSVYLEKGGSTEKLLELECGGDLHRSEDTFKGRIKKLEEKLDEIAGDHAQVSSLENRLTSIQQKLDNITSLLSSHLHE